MGSMCQNSAVVLGWMGGLHAQITHHTKKMAKTSASGEIWECARFGKTTCEKMPKKVNQVKSVLVHLLLPLNQAGDSQFFLCTGMYQK